MHCSTVVLETAHNLSLSLLLSSLYVPAFFANTIRLQCILLALVHIALSVMPVCLSLKSHIANNLPSLRVRQCNRHALGPQNSLCLSVVSRTLPLHLPIGKQPHNNLAPVSALFRTSFTCAPEEKLAEPEIEVEPLSPRRAAAKAAFTSAPFPRIEVDPPALALTLPSSEASEKPTTVATVRVTNSGGLQGAYHVCTDNRPAWLRVEGAMGALAPGDKSELTLLVDLVEARAAAAQGSAGGLELPAEYRDSVCAVLRVEVDEGGAGMLLPVVCRFAKSG